MAFLVLTPHSLPTWPSLGLSVCVYVLTEISMDTLSQYACVRPTLLGVLCKRTQQCWTTLGWSETKEMLGACFEQFQCSPNNVQQVPTTSNKSQQRPTSPNNVQQVPTTLNRVCRRAKHVHWTMLSACSVNMFSAFARGLGPVHTTPFSNENDTVLFRIRLPSTLQRSENGSFQKRSPQWNDLKTVLFENAVFLVWTAKTI